MEAINFGTLLNDLHPYMMEAILYLYQQTPEKQNNVVLLGEPFDLEDNSGYSVTGITIDEEQALMFTEVDEYDNVQDPQFLSHLSVSELQNVMTELEKTSGKTFDKPFTWANVGTDNPRLIIEIEGGNVQDIYGNTSKVPLVVIDYDNKSQTDEDEEYEAGIFMVFKPKTDKQLNKLIRDACKRK